MYKLCAFMHILVTFNLRAHPYPKYRRWKETDKGLLLEVGIKSFKIKMPSFSWMKTRDRSC